jgi:hypothetical protein
MPCDSKAVTVETKAAQVDALARLARSLELGDVQLVVGSQGAVAFRRWAEADRAGLADLCAFRRLKAAGSPELRRALARAEALAGVQVNARTVAAGVHSHDGGRSWGKH